VKRSRRRTRSSSSSPAACACFSTFERLLADRIVLCWWQVHYADIVCARLQGGTLQQREYYQRCQERAQRRYLAAIRSLACVRRLLQPGVQVNIAARQVNVA
jgi:hypothetical protein